MSNRTRIFCRALVGALGAGLFVVSAAQAVTKGPVTDDIGVVVIPKGAPIVLGGYWVLSGADSALGIDQKRGVELAIKDHGGSLLGHAIKLIAEDSQCNAEGGQTAATKLASHSEMVAVVGPSCSSEATPGAPILWKAGMIDICTSCTAPSLTAPERKPDYAGFLRTVYSDADQGRYDAKYVHDVLKAQTVVTIHDGSPRERLLGAGAQIAQAHRVALDDGDKARAETLSLLELALQRPAGQLHLRREPRGAGVGQHGEGVGE